MKKMNADETTERSGLILDETDLDGKPLHAKADDSDGTDGAKDTDGTDSDVADADGTDGDSTDTDGKDGDGTDGDSGSK